MGNCICRMGGLHPGTSLIGQKVKQMALKNSAVCLIISNLSNIFAAS